MCYDYLPYFISKGSVADASVALFIYSSPPLIVLRQLLPLNVITLTKELFKLLTS